MTLAAKVSDIPEGGKKLVEVEGTEVLLVKVRGTIYACENECPHQGTPLAGSMVKDPGLLVCPRHGYRFDLATGECREFPEYTLRTWPVEVRGDEVHVEVTRET